MLSGGGIARVNANTEVAEKGEAFKGQDIFFSLIGNQTITGKISEVGSDFVCVHTGDTANYIPFHATVHFQKSGTETFSAEYIGPGASKQ